MATGSSGAASLFPGLNEKDLTDLYETLYPVRRKYKSIGLQIGVIISEIENIEAQYGDLGDRLLKILSFRILHTEEVLEWGDVESALRSSCVGESKIANAIRKKYGHLYIHSKCTSGEYEKKVPKREVKMAGRISDQTEKFIEVDTHGQFEMQYEMERFTTGVIASSDKFAKEVPEAEAKSIFDALDLQTSSLRQETESDVDFFDTTSTSETNFPVHSKRADEYMRTQHPREIFDKPVRLQKKCKKTKCTNVADKQMHFYNTKEIEEDKSEFEDEISQECEVKWTGNERESFPERFIVQKWPARVRKRGENEEKGERELASAFAIDSGADNGRCHDQSRGKISEARDRSRSINPRENSPSFSTSLVQYSKQHKQGLDGRKRKHEWSDLSSSSSSSSDSDSFLHNIFKDMSDAEKKKLQRVFKRLFGRLSYAIKSPVETATLLQKEGLLSRSVMRDLLLSPESNQEKAIALVVAVGKRIKPCPQKIFKVINVFLCNEMLEETGKEMWIEAGMDNLQLY